MKMTTRLPVAISTAIALAGCMSMGESYDRPAHIVNPDDASRAELQAAINAMFGIEVTLAEDALTDSSLLTVERRPRSTMENPNPLGRNMELPFQVTLVMNGPDCFLIDQRDRSRYVLTNTACEAE